MTQSDPLALFTSKEPHIWMKFAELGDFSDFLPQL
jgi:hypothetical protein